MQAVADEVLASVGKEENDTEGIAYPGNPEGCAIGKELRCYATNNDAQAEACLPSREQGTVGCTSLRVRCHVDEHRLERGEHVTVTKTDNEGCSVEAP